MKIPIIGYEKAWAVLFSGAMATSVTILVMWPLSQTGAFESPGPEELKQAVVGVISVLFATFSAFITGNTDISKKDKKEEVVE